MDALSLFFVGLVMYLGFIAIPGVFEKSVTQ